MEKIEKLKEVNATLKKILADMETRIFIDNIGKEGKKKIPESQPRTSVELI